MCLKCRGHNTLSLNRVFLLSWHDALDVILPSLVLWLKTRDGNVLHSSWDKFVLFSFLSSLEWMNEHKGVVWRTRCTWLDLIMIFLWQTFVHERSHQLITRKGSLENDRNRRVLCWGIYKEDTWHTLDFESYSSQNSLPRKTRASEEKQTHNDDDDDANLAHLWLFF